MRRVTFFGKGGIGKSTVTASIGALFRQGGDRVLHVGCDPKHDSSLLHGPEGTVPTVMGEFIRLAGRMGPAEVERCIIEQTRTGVHVLEAGGPEPGQGCAGRAVSLTLTLLESVPRVRDGGYDVLLLDVLGDVVCGGFVAPLRSPHPADVVIVTSRDFMSLYAANNIAKGIANPATAGASRLVGIVGNRVDDEIGSDLIASFAARLGTRLLGCIPSSNAVMVAAVRGLPILEGNAASSYGDAIRVVHAALLATGPEDRGVPTPVADGDLRELYASTIPLDV